MNQLGEVVHVLPPSPGNPRNSEGAFIRLTDGKLLFIYSKFDGVTNDDNDHACLAALHSSDEGKTWSDKGVVAAPEEHDALNVMSVSLLRMMNGDIGLFYLVYKGWHDSRLILRRSSDEGMTWGEPLCCMSDAGGNYVVNNDRVIRLSSGRLVIPAAFHRMSNRSYDRRSLACFYLSDDDGVTWREARTYGVLPSVRSRSGMNEPGVIELSNGALWSWSRTDLGRQYEMFSFDEGETWTVPDASLFTSSRSPLSMKRMPYNGQLLAVWNPIPNYMTRHLEKGMHGRAPLVGAVSDDEGQSWGRYFIVEKEEDRGGSCYTAMHFTEDAVLLAYCSGEPADGDCLSRLKIRRMAANDIVSIPAREAAPHKEEPLFSER